MGNKYNTNPLDADFPEKVGHSQHTQAIGEKAGQTTEFPPPSITEEQTRRFDDPEVSAYQAPSIDMGVANASLVPSAEKSPARRVPGLMFSERTLTALVYIPFTIGFVAGFVVLLLASRSEAKLRFHAAQALAAHIAIIVIGGFLSMVNQNFGAFIFGTVTTVMLIVFVIKAWKDKPIHVEAIEPMTEWLEEKISTQTKWS